jgi:hypothetical protein
MLVNEGGEIAQLFEESSRRLNEFLPSRQEASKQIWIPNPV